MSWRKIDENTLDKIKKQERFEKQTAKKLTHLYESARNPLIKALIHSIVLDTTKHAEAYQMLINLNSSALMGKESEDLGNKEIADHLKKEAFMLRQTEEISNTVKDKSIKQVILNILEDEKKHHRVLTEIFNMLQKESREWDAHLYDLMTGFP